MREIKGFKVPVSVIETTKELDNYLENFEDDSLLTFDWEAVGLGHDATPLLLSLHQRGVNPAVVPIDFFFKSGLPIEDVAFVCNKHYKRLRLVAHNAKYDSMINVMNGFEDCGRIFADTLIMIHLVNPELEKKLEVRVQKDFGVAKQDFKELTGKGWDKINWSTEGEGLLDTLCGYAGEDTFYTTKLYYKYRPLMDKDALKIHDDIEIPMVKILRDAKIRGVLIDVPLLKSMEVEVDDNLSKLMQDIYEECGCVFNLNSPKQKQEVFFEKMGLPVISYTKTGGKSTDAATMEEWSDMGYRIGELLVSYSELNKLNSGYIKAIPNMVDSKNVLRGDINSCGTKTGRASSSNPNLQNQPNNSDYPVRDAFIPRPGHVFLNYDYSQLELRIMAHMSKDKHFVEVFRSGGDPHGDVAMRLGIPRKGAKTVNFGILYGMGPEKLAKVLGISIEEAKRIIQVDYMRTYTGFAVWKENTENFAIRNGYCQNLFGRKRLLPDAMKHPDKIGKKAYYGALRRAVNTPIQGTAADIVKIATIKAVNRFAEEKVDAHFLLQVHDELLVEVSYADMYKAQKILIESMENAVPLDVPLDVDGKIVLKWGEMKSDDILSLPFRFDYSLISSLL